MYTFLRSSTRVNYGLIIMYDLAAQGKTVRLSSISERYKISEKYLSQIVISLRSGGLISSTRGSKGGYFLQRPADKIKLTDIIKNLEGSDSSDGTSTAKKEGMLQAQFKIYQELNKEIEDRLGKLSLQDFVAIESKYNKDVMYYI
jgi:Rrf2 family transcriptional regulator, cysteine metabolism repressor